MKRLKLKNWLVIILLIVIGLLAGCQQSNFSNLKVKVKDEAGNFLPAQV